MGKFLRVIGYLIGIVVVLIVGLSIAVPLLLDPNDFKDQITEVVHAKTGRELTLGGDIGLTVFPWLGVELADVQLSNAKGFGEAPFARIDSAKVRVKLLPLLRKQVEMDTVTLAGLQLNLAKDQDGRSNWDDLAGATQEPSPGKAKGGPAALAGLAVGGIHLRDTRIVWDDRSTGSRYVVDGLYLNTGAVQLESPFDFDVAFQLQSAKPEMRSDIKLSGEMWVSDSLQQFQVRGLKVSVDAQANELPGGRVQGDLQAELQLDLEKQSLELAGLVLEALGLQLAGDFRAGAVLSEEPTFSGSFDLRPFVLRELVKALGQEVPATTDATVLGKADGHLELKGSTDRIQVDPFRLRFDDSELRGKLGISNFAAPVIQIDLNLDAIDLDRYLPPSSKGQGPATPAASAAAGIGMLPVDLLRDLNLSGTLNIGTLKAFGIRSSDVKLAVKARDGKLRLHPASAKMYDGAYRGDVAVDVSGPKPRLSMNESVSNVQVGPLLKDLTGDDKLSGTANVKIKLGGVGNDLPALRRTLNGNLSFSFADGAIKGVNIAQLIRAAKAKLEGKSLPQGQGPNQTDFSELSGTATVTNGVVRNEDFEVKSPLLRMTGKGKVSLPAETIDYLLTVKLVGSLKGQGGEGLASLTGIGIPVRVGGTFSKPTYRPDLVAALGDAVKAKVDESKKELQEKLAEELEERLKDKLDDQLIEQLKDGLKGLF
ncbi:MAG: AsmA family protein [Gammaproteobacteria bacterium]